MKKLLLQLALLYWLFQPNTSRSCGKDNESIMEDEKSDVNIITGHNVLRRSFMTGNHAKAQPYLVARQICREIFSAGTVTVLSPTTSCLVFRDLFRIRN